METVQEDQGKEAEEEMVLVGMEMAKWVKEVILEATTAVVVAVATKEAEVMALAKLVEAAREEEEMGVDEMAVVEKVEVILAAAVAGTVAEKVVARTAKVAGKEGLAAAFLGVELVEVVRVALRAAVTRAAVGRALVERVKAAVEVMAVAATVVEVVMWAVAVKGLEEMELEIREEGSMAEAEAESVVDLAEVVVEQEVEDLGRVARVEAFLDWVLLGASARVVMGAQQAEAVRVAVVAAVAEVMGSAKLVVEMVVEEEEVALEEEETAPVALDWVVVVDSGQVDTLEGRTVAVTQVANVEERGAAAKEDKTAAVGSEAGKAREVMEVEAMAKAAVVVGFAAAVKQVVVETVAVAARADDWVDLVLPENVGVAQAAAEMVVGGK